MAVKTKEQLRSDFSDGLIATGQKFSDLLDSLKAVQTAVSDPSAVGASVNFIDSISQDTEGKITATKKTVNFSGYQTTAAMQNYQYGDVQQVGELECDGGGGDYEQEIEHNMRHYPTVRLINGDGEEVRPDDQVIVPFAVKHSSINSLTIYLNGHLNDGTRYQYILD